MGAENNRKTRLQKLSGSDFEIVEGQSDIRGWDVKDASGNQLGEVEELIFDYETRKVRYLVVDLEEDDSDGDDSDASEKEVLVPIGIAELHENNDDVILPGVTKAQLLSLPEYDEDRFDMEHEASVRNVFGGLGASTLAGSTNAEDDFYNHEHFNEANLYRNRSLKNSDNESIPLSQEESKIGNKMVGTGIRLRSGLTDRTVPEDINTQHETDIDDELHSRKGRIDE